MHVALISFLANSINTRLLSSYLKEQGYEATCFFCTTAFNESNIAELVRVLQEKKVGLVGISLVTDDYQAAVQVTTAVKQALSVPVIWGGAHVNVRPEESLLHANMICRGEGEEALLELVRNIASGSKTDTTIRNIWFNTQTGIIRNELRLLEENLDKYPFPDFDVESQYFMTEHGLGKFSKSSFNNEYSIMTSRGCPYNCCYCYNSYRRKNFEGKGKYLRARSIENVVEELRRAKQYFGQLKMINFWDDSFVARNIDEFVKFKELYTRDISLPFFALIEPMAFNNEKMRILKDAGLQKLQVGIQTGSERVNREVYNRPVSSRKIIDVAHMIKSLGIDVIYDIIFNNPYETQEDLIETIRVLAQFPRRLILQGYNLIFYPGTTLTDRALKDEYISEKKQESFEKIQGKMNSPTVSSESVISSRYYHICYDSKDKEYYNRIIALLGFKYIPLSLVRFFAASQSNLKKMLLVALMKTYIDLFKLKARLRLYIWVAHDE